jgi:GT2 family glycosyltransferase
MIKVLISILNWNSSDKTLQCLTSLALLSAAPNIEIFLRIIDNGSSDAEFFKLNTLLPKNKNIALIRNPVNLGFTGGQNLNIQYALDNSYDYIWLLNNDTVVHKNSLQEIVNAMESDMKCGASSPIIVRLGSPDIVDFCGAVHEWSSIDTIRPQSLNDAPLFLEAHKSNIWAVGTALMIRATTAKQIGALSEGYFAYYEDDDFGMRLIANGWRTLIVLSAQVEHACFEGDMFQRQPYFFYLMNRNAIFFATTHVPTPFRRNLRLKYIDRSFFMAEKLSKLGYFSKADACILGMADGLSGKSGPPRLDRPIPLWAKALRPVFRFWNGRNH